MYRELIYFLNLVSCSALSVSLEYSMYFSFSTATQPTCSSYASAYAFLQCCIIIDFPFDFPFTCCQSLSTTTSMLDFFPLFVSIKFWFSISIGWVPLFLGPKPWSEASLSLALDYVLASITTTISNIPTFLPTPSLPFPSFRTSKAKGQRHWYYAIKWPIHHIQNSDLQISPTSI